MLKTVYVPERVKEGISPLKDEYEPAPVWGVDFETVSGIPYTLQWANEKETRIEYLERPGDGIWYLLDRAAECTGNIRAYFWHLPYDLPCLLFDCLEHFKKRDFALSAEYGGRKIKIFVSCARSWFAKILFGKKRRIDILDAAQFWRCKLDTAAEKVLKERKYPHPAGLGSKRLRGRAFEQYALRDATLTRRLALLIEKQHEDGRISKTVSASHFAAKVFRKHFLEKTIPYPEKRVETAGMLSYHGGLNYVTPGVPALYRRVYEYDISSAYPAAFVQLPDFCMPGGRWIRGKDTLGAPHGFVKVRWGARRCQYGCWRDHGFQDRPAAAWITLYEYYAARNCYPKHTILDGFHWSGGGPSPFRAHMEHFYALKTSAPDAVTKDFAKICLNGISGKLVQNREDESGEFVAGGLFNPAIASLVTGHTRAALHGLLHSGDGIHAATDSVISARPNLAAGAGMGAVEKKTFGDLLLLRNKLYVFFEPNTEKIIKWGGHGFWGDKETLIKLWKEKSGAYKINHIYKVREAFAQDKTPLKMLEGITRTLSICWDKFAEVGPV